MDSTIIQWYVFLYTVYGGILIGAAYDALSALRRMLRAKKWAGVLLDCLFCVFAAAIILAVLYRAAAGQIRAFLFLGFAIGFILYMAGLQKLIRFICRLFTRSCKNGTVRSIKMRKDDKN